MFEKASRLKIRFPYRGQITTEDLWDLELEDLDAIYKNLNAKAKASREESLLVETSKPDETLTTQIDIIKHVVEVKQKEAADRKNAADKRRRKKELIEILAEKQNADLKGKSVEEITKMIEEMDN